MNISRFSGTHLQNDSDTFIYIIYICIAQMFRDLLDLIEDSIEISYNSAGVLAHIVSDGDEAWSEVSISRQDVMEHIVRV